MTTILAALGPVFGLIVVGAILRWTGPVGDEGWRGIENLTSWVLLPALMVLKLGGTDLSAYEIAPLVAAMAGGVLTITPLPVGLHRPRGSAEPAHQPILTGRDT